MIGNRYSLQKEVDMNISTRRYVSAEVISFAKTSANFGELSNMAPKFPLFINDVLIPSSECLYQACKFPLFPNIQKEIIEERNPMLAKLISRRYTKYVRNDWDDVKYKVMEWCLATKLIQNWDSMYDILLATGNKPIVEYSKSDDSWGAISNGMYLVGKNALGRLLMQIREDYIFNGRQREKLFPPDIVGFLLFGYPIGLSLIHI